MDTILDIAARRGSTRRGSTLRGSTLAERKAADEKVEREFDRRMVERLKRRPPTDLKDLVPWSVVKKRNGL